METKTASTGTIRYWAAARGAAGTAEESYRAGALAQALEQARSRHADEPRFARVLGVCSFLVDGAPVGVRDHASVAEAFAACRKLIDTLKHEVPVWKRQIFTDGATEWVGAC